MPPQEPQKAKETRSGQFTFIGKRGASEGKKEARYERTWACLATSGKGPQQVGQTTGEGYQQECYREREKALGRIILTAGVVSRKNVD